MMLKRFLIAAMLFLAACQSAPPPPTQTSAITPDTSTATGWIETQMNGISLGMWKPAGWETETSNGLVVAEYSLTKNGGGMVVYCFVPPSDEFVSVDDTTNYAWAVLTQVQKMPAHSGWDVAMTPPIGFDWAQSSAAYYLYSTGDGVRALVLALTLPSQPRVVVCNINVPTAQADRIRTLLPQLLDGLTVNGVTMPGADLDKLPNPLVYPRYNRPPPPQHPPATNSPVG